MSTSSFDYRTIDALRDLKKLSARQLAQQSGVSPGNLSGWLRGAPGRLGAERIGEVVKALGLDPSGSLQPGIHRWTTTMGNEDIERFEHVVRSLLPGGVEAIFIWGNESMTELFILGGIARSIYIFRPRLRPDIRIILILRQLSPKSFLPSARSIRIGALGAGSFWYGGSRADQHPGDSFIEVPQNILHRLLDSEDLSVQILDDLLGLDPSKGHNWTWEMVNSELDARGITPEETARKMGLV